MTTERAAGRVEALRRMRLMAVVGIAGIALISLAGMFLARALFPGLDTTAGILVGAGLTMVIAALLCSLGLRAASGPIERSNEQTIEYEARLESEARRREFETRVVNALEMAEDEPEVLAAVERALTAIVPNTPVELLLADNSHAHLERMVAVAPDGNAPNCTVDSPNHCPAARRAQVQRFDDSDAVDACPKLIGRVAGGCSALCVPVSIMGRTVGVIHALGRAKQSVDAAAVEDVHMLSNQIGARLGMLRIMAEAQIQASVDGLTGLYNRRTVQNRVRSMRRDADSIAIAIADLDRFKVLNDTHGHETGDRALRVFADALKSAVRDEDVVGRYGGEEFVLAFPDCSLAEAYTILERIREHLDTATRGSGLPAVTASFGLVQALDGETFDDTVRRADTALFAAKASGRDRVVVHAPDGSPIEVGLGQRPVKREAVS
ncbi:MAG TPA: diguanylate cyclase [Acidimicrobiia bacterium]